MSLHSINARLLEKDFSTRHLIPCQPSFQDRPSLSTQAKLLHQAEKRLFVEYGRTAKMSRIYIPERHLVLETRDVQSQPFSEDFGPQRFSVEDDSVHIPHRQPISPCEIRGPTVANANADTGDSDILNTFQFLMRLLLDQRTRPINAQVIPWLNQGTTYERTSPFNCTRSFNKR